MLGYLGLTGTMDSDGVEWDCEGPQQTVGVPVPGALPVTVALVLDSRVFSVPKQCS